LQSFLYANVISVFILIFIFKLLVFFQYIYANEDFDTSKIILDFEPNEAIFVPNNKPLIFYNAIVNFSKKSLRKGGKLYFEFYSENLIKIKHILQKNKFHNIEVKRDFNEKNRFISAIKK
tara:strand:+ start:241 stop:600 length:360 start_codon:yes stop_codon:yes gene_type:complete